ncbi:MAG: TonB-dependent receptor [Gammaproteobacteria bacterium]|nr:TonB-dependent receptor [Gammaproteobacteria bacterium]
MNKIPGKLFTRYARNPAWLAAGAMFGIAAAAGAQPAGIEDAPLLEPVEVTVPPQAERSKSTSFINQRDMRGQHMQNMNDVLFSMLPGVATARRSNLGFMGPGSGFIIRGLIRERVAVFVDGIPSQVNNHFHPLVDQYSPDLIERIEVIRGPSSVLHGASAAGGVIDIYTHRASRRGPAGYLSLAGGRFDTVEGQYRASYGWGSGSMLAGGTYRDTNGHRANSQFDAHTVNFKVAQDLATGWTAGLRAGATRAEIENPGTAARPSMAQGTQDPTNLALTLDRKTGSSNSFLALYWNENEVKSLRNGAGRVTDFVRFKEAEYGARAKHGWNHAAGTNTVGLDWVLYDDRRRNNATAPFAEHAENFFSPYIQTVAAVDEKSTVDAGLRLSFGSQFGLDVAPEIGAVHNLYPDLALRARAGRGFRVPRVNDVQLIGTPGAISNERLNPESFWNLETGINKRFGERAEFDAAFWWMSGDNLIQLVGSQNRNTGEFTHRGLESLLAIRVHRHLRLLFAGTVMDLRGDTANIPQSALDIGADFQYGKLRINLTSRYAGDLYGSDNETNKLDSYYVADLHVGYDIGYGITAYMDIDNITDDDYETLAGYPQVPRAVFFGLRKTVGR